jgi:branched-subunit amino acid aminotransferase/4-amino-4-deoxychorismate lyase
MPVTEIDGRVIRNARRGELTAKLQALFDEHERGAEL